MKILAKMFLVDLKTYCSLVVFSCRSLVLSENHALAAWLLCYFQF